MSTLIAIPASAFPSCIRHDKAMLTYMLNANALCNNMKKKKKGIKQHGSSEPP